MPDAVPVTNRVIPGCYDGDLVKEGGRLILTSRFDQALAYALVVHGGQLRKGTEVTYISHLLMVAAMVLEYGGTEDDAIAALLHDAVEDGGGACRLADIRQRFGERVADIVMGCSDTDVAPKPPTIERRRLHVEHLRTIDDRLVMFVSACDKLANARSILKDYRVVGERLWSRFNVGKAETLGYYETLVNVFAERGDTPVGLELARVVAELTEVAASQPPPPPMQP
jgi:(p)ppGpp synthase/HD superfamily hydrolase